MLRRHGPYTYIYLFDTVSAFDLSTKSVLKAVDMGIADAASSTLQECVQGADAVLVAVPVLAIEKVMEQIEPFLGDDTLITDVGSVRGVVIDGARRVLKEKFVNYARCTRLRAVKCQESTTPTPIFLSEPRRFPRLSTVSESELYGFGKRPGKRPAVICCA